jgi:putative phage-type endonuclease
MKIVYADQDDQEKWKEERKKYIGASEIAAAMGLSKWKSARNLFLEKTGQIPGYEGNKRTELGHHMEPLLKKWFEEETGHVLRRRNAFCIHEDFEWMSCTLDFHITGSGIPVEMKTTAFASDDWKGETIPAEYFWQCQQQLMITDKPYMFIAVYCFQDASFTIKKVEPDMTAMTAIRNLGGQFWQNLKDGIEPGISWNDDRNDFALEITEAVEKANLDSLHSACVRRDELNDLKKQVEQELLDINNRIKFALQEYRYGNSIDYQIQWNRGEKKMETVFNQDRLAMERPDIFKSYCDQLEVNKKEYFRVERKG